MNLRPQPWTLGKTIYLISISTITRIAGTPKTFSYVTCGIFLAVFALAAGDLEYPSRLAGRMAWKGRGEVKPTAVSGH